MNDYYQGHYTFARRDTITWAVQRLIVVNVVVFAVQLLLDIPLGYGVDTWVRGGLPGGIPAYLLSFQPQTPLFGLLWKPFTYMFLHGGLSHLFFNMLWLFFFGPDVERALGTRQFLRFYFICGALAVLATYVPFFMHGRPTSVLGASGAVMGVLIAFAMINPERQLFLFPLPIPLNARGLVLIVIFMNVIGAIGGADDRSFATHLGGMAVAFAYMRMVPLLRFWSLARQREKDSRKRGDGPEEDLGDAVDNIFRFEDRKRGGGKR